MLKKKLPVILVFLMLCCYFFNTTDASNKATLQLNSNQEIIDKGEEVEISIKIERCKTAAYNFSLYFDEEKLEYVSEIENANVIGNRIVFIWFDKNGGKSLKEGELVSIKFKAKEEGRATFAVDGEFYDEKGQLIPINFQSKQIQIGKENSNLYRQEREAGNNTEGNNANLQVLRLDREGITPDFNKDVYEYYLTIPTDVKDIDVVAISENPNAKIEISGNDNLKNGLNNIVVQVDSEDKTQSNRYNIQVTKTANLELANTNLEILALENVLLNVPFNRDQTNYKAEISNEMKNIHILAVPENEQATVEINGKDNLKEGNNLVEITVTAPNGFSKKKYQIEVYRRNVNEEKQYQEELLSHKDDLEEAYEIENLSTRNR